MHMGNELMTPGVGVVFIAVSAAGLSYATKKAGIDLDDKRVPLMGVMGAFIFAVQMINFPVLAGTSGHLGGGFLLAVTLGPHLAVIIMASILAIQCLIFQDGGLLALGANILNLGLIPAYLGIGIYRSLRFLGSAGVKNSIRIFTASLISVVAGAVMVPVEVGLTGLYAVPFETFLLLMAGVHVLIGSVEGIITVGVVGALSRLRPGIFQAASVSRSFSKLTTGLLIVTLCIAGFVSYYASSHPDGLEWVTERLGMTENGVAGKGLGDAVGKLTERISIFPDYAMKSEVMREESPRLSKGLSGAVGSLVTLVLLVFIGSMVRRKRNRAGDAS